MSTAWTTCRLCGGKRVPFGYVGDVIGLVCMCRFERAAATDVDPSRIVGVDFPRIIAERDALRAEVEKLRTTIKNVAAIAHCGGWVGLREDQALVYVRALTVSSMPGGSLNDATAVLQGAIDAARAAQGGET